MHQRIEAERFDSVLRILEERFPSLVIEESPWNYDRGVVLAAQPGLDFRIHVGLDNFDELQIRVGEFCSEWFPCGEQEQFDRFVLALTGLISGRNRIVEKRIFGMYISSNLESPTASGRWNRLGRHSVLLGFIPWPRTVRIIRNTQGPEYESGT